MSPEPNVTGSEIPTIVTYDHETHFDVNKKHKIGNRTFWISGSDFFIAVEKVCF